MFRNLKRCVPRLAQPSPFSHPHLMKEGELTIGVQFGEYVQRRDHFCSLFPPNSLIILPGACRARWTNDLYWPFRQESNFWYLTGFEEPNALAVFHTYSPLDTSQNVLIDPPKLPSRGSEKYTYYLICEEPNEHSDLWDGPRAGTNGACEVFGADKAISRNATGAFLNQLLEENRYTSIYYPSSKAIFAPETDQEVRKCLTKAGVRTLASPDAHFWTMRALKSSAVQTMMKRAAKITHAAFLSGMRSTRPGRNESHIAAAMDFTLQTLGAQRFAYVPVIASGDNALSLHYIRNDSLMRDNTMVMVDAGAEYHYYPTDCTRAWPVNGSFTKAQRILYNAVLEVQEDLLKRTVAGEHSHTLQRYSEDRLLEVLLRSEVIQRQRASTEEQQREVLKQIYPHAWGHFMGIDIHEQVTASSSVFQEGMMHTVEPGVYIPHNLKIAVNDAYRGIGFRIEDNVILGGLGLPSENITESIPKSIEEIEHLMKSDSPVINSVATALESVLTHF